MDIEQDTVREGIGQHVGFQPRFAKLRQFISDNSFSHEELRYLRILLSAHRIDIIGELPIELVVQIAERLSISDFAACSAVSRRWREAFLSSPVLAALTNKFCPSFAHRPGRAEAEATQEENLEALRRIERSRCANGHWHFATDFEWEHESYFKLDPEYHNSHEDAAATYARYNTEDNDPRPNRMSPLGALYSSGKIAWRPKRRVVAVDSFWSRTRKIFSVPNGPLVSSELRLMAMGNELVVGSMDRLIVAWDHVRNAYQEKRLPGSVKCAATRGLRIAVILYSGDVFLWEFGGSIEALTTAPLVNYHRFAKNTLIHWQSNLTAVFHPTCNKTLFLASAYDHTVDSRTTTLKRVVYEFQGMQHTRTFEIGTVPVASRRTGLVWIRKLLPYRRDIIGFWEQPFKHDINETFVEFDIYDRSFTARNGEVFDSHEFGWRTTNSDADLDFSVGFNGNSYVVATHQPGFDFGTGQVFWQF
ncbi:hypothetical protein GGR52DRAFT_577803 [Hypoxylon sp. FL1284]|nr:hypothetical protein GGR52DRAFT_577803 [Hypoxylon sp. FL1284]